MNTIIAIALVCFFPALSIYADTLVQDYSNDQYAQMAIQFIMDSPTYSFDGIEGSIKVLDSIVLESYPEQYVVTIYFKCSHAGYGDRTDMMLAQVITEHTARITIVNQEVQSAFIDDTWDELNQREKDAPEILSLEGALDILMAYLNENYDEAEALEITPEWSVANRTPEGMLGASTIEYSGDGWTIIASYPVVWKPTYSFEVVHESGFTWNGTVNQDGEVTETQ